MICSNKVETCLFSNISMIRHLYLSGTLKLGVATRMDTLKNTYVKRDVLK